MKTKLRPSRLLLNQSSLSINIIIGYPENEKWITINRGDDLYSQFIREFSNVEVMNFLLILKNKNRKMDAIFLAKSYFLITLLEAKQMIETLKQV